MTEREAARLFIVAYLGGAEALAAGGGNPAAAADHRDQAERLDRAPRDPGRFGVSGPMPNVDAERGSGEADWPERAALADRRAAMFEAAR